MENLQKKSLQHVITVLNKFDTYPIYRELKIALETAKVSHSDMMNILNKLQTETSPLKQIVDEAKEWVEIVIKSIDTDKK